MFKTICLCVTLLSATGCGTVQSLQSHSELREDMRARKSHCSSLPHLYSGIAYNFCILNAEQSNPNKPDLGMHVVIFDTAFSAIADTGLIPYTLYKQLTRENINIE